ncbi:MAG: dUTP diphosphatase [Oscillospiraceae bacterium]|jgi:dUTP pyrophosphatase|nr:dUTP diphosphatase [Oscillospiraceae bacterium]
MNIPIKKLRENAILPKRQSGGAAGFDLYAAVPEDAPVVIAPGTAEFIPHGVALAIPEGFAGFIYARSGLAAKSGISPSNCVGVIDSDYRGELITSLYNRSDTPFTVRCGDRAAQLVIAPIIAAELTPADTLPETERGAGGYGSTGR